MSCKKRRQIAVKAPQKENRTASASTANDTRHVHGGWWLQCERKLKIDHKQPKTALRVEHCSKKDEANDK
jgi:hypothetical protein